MPASRQARVISVALARTITGVSNFLILIALARLLPKSAVATYQQVFLVYAFVAPFLQLGVGQGFYYFLPTENNRPRGRVADAIAATLLSGLLFSLFIGLGGADFLGAVFENQFLAPLLLWLIPYAILSTPASQVQHALISQGQEFRSTAFIIARETVVGIATLTPLLIFATVDAAVAGHVCATVIMSIIAIRLMIRSAPCGRKNGPSPKAISELLAYSFPLGLALMFGALSKQLDKLIVSAMSSPETFAVYSLGAMELPLIAIVTGSITVVTLSDLRKAVLNRNFEEASRLFRTIAEKSSYILLPAMAFFLVAADSFVTAFFTHSYAESSMPFRIYLALIPARIAILGSLLATLGETKSILNITLIGLLLNLLLSVLLVATIGPNGAAIATVSVILLWSIPSNARSIARASGIHWSNLFPWRSMGDTALFLICPTVLVVAFEYAASQWSPMARLTVDAVLFGIPIVFWWGRGRLFNWNQLGTLFPWLKSSR